MKTKKEFHSFFEETYDELIRFLYYFSGNYQLSEDIAQDAYLKLWEKRDELHNTNSKGLLFSMAKNQWLNQIKHRKVVHNFEKKSGEKVVNSTPEFILEEKEFSEKLESVISRMNEKQRIVFLLNRIEKKKYKEIAATLQISVKAVEKRMGLALAFIREHLDRKL